jgi:hypothetical protein
MWCVDRSRGGLWRACGERGKNWGLPAAPLCCLGRINPRPMVAEIRDTRGFQKLILIFNLILIKFQELKYVCVRLA